jgi:tetratricopeptide (TPR) repeat protein
MQWLRELALSYDLLGALALDAKRNDEAIGYFRKEVAVRTKVVAAEPTDIVRQRELAGSYGLLGSALAAADMSDEARSVYGKALSIIESYAATDPGNATWQIDLATCLYRLAQLGDEPRRRLERALAILRRLDAAGALSEDQKPWIPGLEQAIAAAAQ